MNTSLALQELESVRTEHVILVVSVGSRQPVRLRVAARVLYSALHGNEAHQNLLASYFKIKLNEEQSSTSKSKISFVHWNAITYHALTEDRHELPRGSIKLTHSL